MIFMLLKQIYLIVTKMKLWYKELLTFLETLHNKSLVVHKIYGNKLKPKYRKIFTIIHNLIHKFGKKFHMIYLHPLLLKHHNFSQQKLFKFSMLLLNKQILEINFLLLGNNKSKNTNSIIDFISIYHN
jgi:hypothetical protein